MQEHGMSMIERIESNEKEIKAINNKIKENGEIIKAKGRSLRREIYNPAIKEEIKTQIDAYEEVVEQDLDNLDMMEYEMLVWEYILWEREASKTNQNLPTAKGMSIFNPLRRFYNAEAMPKGMMDEIIDRLITISLSFDIREEQRRRVKEEEKNGTRIAEERKTKIYDEVESDILDNTTYEQERNKTLDSIEKTKPNRISKEKAGTNIRERLEKMARKRGKPEITIARILKERDEER